MSSTNQAFGPNAPPAGGLVTVGWSPGIAFEPTGHLRAGPRCALAFGTVRVTVTVIEPGRAPAGGP